MSVKSIIDRLIPFAPGWSRVGSKGILPLIEKAQDRLLDSEYWGRIFIGTENQGMPPYLKTVKGTYRYELVNSNLSCTLVKNIGGIDRIVRVDKVIGVRVNCKDERYYYENVVGSSYAHSYSHPYRQFTYRFKVIDIPGNGSDALENTNAYWEFVSDPGDTTNIYFIEFTWRAPRLTSENIPLVVPDAYEEAIRDYVIGEIQFLTNGKPNEFQQKFETYWKDKFDRQMSGNAKSQNNDTQLIVC